MSETQEISPEDFAVEKPEINLEEFNKLQDEIFTEHISIAMAKKGLEERNAKLILKKKELEGLLNAYEMRESVCEQGRVSFVSKRSFKVPTGIPEKKLLFDFIKDKYGKEELMGKVTINSAKLNSWANEEMDLATEREEHDFVIPGLGKSSLYEQLKFTPAKKGKKK